MSNGRVWLEEFFENPSIVAVCFEGPALDEQVRVGLTREGVEATIDLLEEWLVYNEERMEELFSDLSEMGEIE